MGQELREAREARGIKLETIEEETKIRRKYLIALESGKWDEIPGEVYVKGFLRTYANYLGLDGAALVNRYKELSRVRVQAEAAQRARRQAEPALEPRPALEARPGPQARPAVMAPSPGVARGKPGRAGRIARLVLALLVLGALAAVVVLAGIYLASRDRPVAGEELQGQGAMEPPATGEPAPESPTPPEQEPADRPAGEQTAPQKREPAPPVAAVTPLPPRDQDLPFQVTGDRLQVVLTVKGDCWVEVWVDGRYAFEATLSKGARREIVAQDKVRIRLGRPPEAVITVNGVVLDTIEARSPRNVILERLPSLP